MLHITFSNRYEALREALMAALEESSPAPFAAEQIIVPSAGLRRDLTLAIAGRRGVCTQVEFSFLAQWLWRQMARALPAVAAESPFAPPVLAWRIRQLLEDPAFAAGQPRLAAYLGRVDAVARFDLAGRIASLLEQYITYRPDWLAAWARGGTADLSGLAATAREDQEWQAALWRAIAGQLGTGLEHPATVFLQSVAALGADARERHGLPAQAHVFCLPAMPPLYLETLRQLARWIDLRLYVPNPCREYWFEVVDPRRLSYLRSQGRADYHETGNRLLAAWGRQCQAHIDLLLGAADPATVDDASFVEAPGETLLARLQNAILDLRELAPGSLAALPEDRSLEVHVCHSLTRELEVLQDRLLGLFGGPDAPGPGDVLVVTPDLEQAAPLVEAVFGNAPRERHIPYAVTGRARSAVNGAARALLALLELAASRLPASAVFDLLRQPPVARRFGLAGDGLATVRGWLVAAGIRWGLDGRHREQQGLPPLERYSFDDGLQRLFLGYALPDGVATPWGERLPAGAPEGADAQVLGLFAGFMAALAAARRTLAQPLLPAAWRAALEGLLESFLLAEGTELDDLGEVRAALRELHDNMTAGGVATPVPLEVVRAALTGLLDDPARGGVPTGQVTFTSIGSLRHLPYRVVCVLGLGDGAFPGTARPAEFDLMALAPRRGDRQRRLDERNLFLDLLLAARDCLHLSYTGRSVRDNSVLPPSVLVAELLETLEAALAASPEARAGARRRIVAEHPLQPFSPACFAVDGEPRLRSHNAELCAALRLNLAAPAAAPGAASDTGDTGDTGDDREDREEQDTTGAPPFFAAPLAPAGPEWREPSLDTLVRFFRNPSRFLLRERLGLDLAAAEAELADDEPFLPGFAGRQALAERLLPHCRAGLAEADLRRLARAGLEYPPGVFGERLLERELQSLQDYARTLAAATGAPCLPPFQARLDFDLDGEPWGLTGSYADLRPEGLVRHRYDDTRPVDYLEAWLHHLFLCARRPAAAAADTRWISRNGSFHLRPCAPAEDILAGLLRLYRQGLRAPLPFFPKAAWAFVASGRLRDAQQAWRSTRDRPWGEDSDPAYRLALRGRPDPLDEAFTACAQAVLGHLPEHLEDPRR